MVLKLNHHATSDKIHELRRLLQEQGLDGRIIKGSGDSIMAVIGDESRKLEFLNSLTNLPYVSSFTPITSPFKPISRDAHPDYNGDLHQGNLVSKEIRAGNFVIGGMNPLGIAGGPCSWDINEPGLMDETAARVKESGAKALRGGAYKTRSDPYSFRGYEMPALELGRRLADKYGLAFVTEPVRTKHIGPVVELADVLQIGARNANQGFYLDVAEATAEKQMPILAKRGMSLKMEDYLRLVLNIYDNDQFANPNMMLCLRGIQTATDATRYTSDVGDVPYLKDVNILPIIGDPSHSAGASRYVVAHAKAFIASGADGLIIEVNAPGGKPLSDAAQAISFKQLEEIVSFAKQLGRM